MIDSAFIIRYTNGLYSTPRENSPSYEEFQDMFSSGQIYSKEWIIRELTKIDPVHQEKKFIIVGAWFGTLGMMIKWKFPSVNITMLDIDPRCEVFLKNITYGMSDMKSVTEDMYTYRYSEQIVVNTSCEHLPNVRWWIDKLPKNTLVVLQSNNFFEGEGHINCVSSADEFIKQTKLSEVLYSGQLEMSMYTRYMIIGKT